ncbi:hypothetical protein Acr_00g0019530 [Actinidia rufa]|uniref:S-locus lectin protein kinase family protein n=1 Tax=Actinidia rufa TaxID=165716 RepID=A0A7J0DDJ4_9ERIC|nr:hypothetical protein Acr_00g0019530 [Actinidia rufa]
MSRTIILIQSSGDQMLTYLFLCTFLFCWSVQFCAASDTLATDASINSTSNETLLSAGKIFELGFFSPDSGHSTYVGIWYYTWKPKVIVWVANRDKPLTGAAVGLFGMDEHCNLVLSDKSGNSYFSTGLQGCLNSSRSVKLLDSGNLVLTDDSSEKSQWESFDRPTDTFLPGMKMYKNLNLTSQTSDDDPRSGSYSLKQHEDDNRTFVIWKTNNMHWISGEADEFNSYTEMPKGVEAMLANFSKLIGGSPRSFVHSGNMTYISYSNNFTSSVSEYKYTRIVMNSSGVLQFWNMNSLTWFAPDDVCSMYNHCGNFESCNSKTSPPCKCFRGFKPSSPDSSEDNSAGCTRKSNVSKNDTFLSLTMMRVGKPDSLIESAKNETSCREECLQNLGCSAYSYVKPSINPQVRTDTCWIWKTDLSNLEEYVVGGHDLYVRIAASDIGIFLLKLLKT